MLVKKFLVLRLIFYQNTFFEVFICYDRNQKWSKCLIYRFWVLGTDFRISFAIKHRFYYFIFILNWVNHWLLLLRFKQTSCLLFTNNSFIQHINFVCKKSQFNWLRTVFDYLRQPVLIKILKTCIISDIEDKDTCTDLLEIVFNNVAIALLPCRVPNFNPKWFILKDYIFYFAIYASSPDYFLRKFLVCIGWDYWWFSDACVT